MNILTILMWLKSHWKIAANAICVLAMIILVQTGLFLHNKNKMLSERLEMAQNNIEAYLDAINGSLLASFVLKLDMDKLSELNDSLIKELDRVRKENKIKAKHLTTAATLKQTINVNGSKGVKGDIITILKDTVYTDSLQYNDLTKVFYSIGTDSVKIRLDAQNTQFLYIYSHKEYKNKKNFFKRLFTFDWKKVTKYKYQIINTNDLFNTEDVRIIESTDK